MAVHIGQQIKQVFDEKGISVTVMARKLNTARSNVYSIFERNTIDTDLLEKISIILAHDFFEYFDPLSKAAQRKQELEHMKEEIIHLKDYVRLLQKETGK